MAPTSADERRSSADGRIVAVTYMTDDIPLTGNTKSPLELMTAAISEAAKAAMAATGKPVMGTIPNAGVAAGPVAPRPVLKLGGNYAQNPCTNRGGQCQQEGTCRNGGTVTKLECPGPPSTVCCTYSSSACMAAGGSCKAVGGCAGKTLDSNYCGDSGSGYICCISDQKLPAPNVGGNCLANFNGMAFAHEALLWYQRYKDPTPQEIEQDRQAAEYLTTLGLSARVKDKDSASFVTNVLESMSWGCVFNVNTGKDVAAIITRATPKLAPFPKLGDLAVWKQQIGIVTNICVGGRAEITIQTSTDGFVNTGCKPLLDLTTLSPATKKISLDFGHHNKMK